jgi:hypothetical protein
MQVQLGVRDPIIQCPMVLNPPDNVAAAHQALYLQTAPVTIGSSRCPAQMQASFISIGRLSRKAAYLQTMVNEISSLHYRPPTISFVAELQIVQHHRMQDTEYRCHLQVFIDRILILLSSSD